MTTQQIDAPQTPVATTAARPLEIAEAPSLHLGMPVVFLGLLAVVALVLTRRKKRQGQWVKVLETTSLGPKRSLVVAKLGDETVLLAISEAGITLLKGGIVRTEPEAAEVPVPPGMWKRDPPAVERGFEAMLAESAEDQELRQKLIAGYAAQVP